ncbi:SPOR domain-containing protein [Ectothiorhodospira sp. 9100]|uniref:SPOR domain-containing protein n=1 Tax=unclassified Ectothiorhodospira TaxID=2684909 RepID=UPI001EE8D17C|nr:SPOR domain-containing protein [Ectothiorhodospira sp. 9100]MCG5518917.1 SPOR domain-containing protein [Ectothiorhodospira sp. 9905]
MEAPLKQRLLGATVLVALAVIFLPMLLDGAGREARLDAKRAIPPEPVFDRPSAAAPRSAGTVAPEVSTPRMLQAPAPDSVREPQARPLPDNAASQPEASTTESRPSARPQPGSTPVSGGWVVQVGSFSQESNARAETERLRQAGFPAFVERTEAEGRSLFRVKVGPELERRAAQGLKTRLQQEQALAGIVVTHP